MDTKKFRLKDLIVKTGNLLLESAMLNNGTINLEYDNGCTVKEVLFEMSKSLPRKQKKHIRKIILK